MPYQLHCAGVPPELLLEALELEEELDDEVELLEELLEDELLEEELLDDELLEVVSTGVVSVNCQMALHQPVTLDSSSGVCRLMAAPSFSMCK